jgi:uncharacterized protein with HEPN domain
MSPLEEAERNSRLWHIASACESILEFSDSRTRQDYDDNRMFRLAVERGLMIIGEAMLSVAKKSPALAAQISDAPRIVALRHRLVHDYPNIDSDEVWRIIHEDVPLLLAEVRALLPPAP